MFLRSNTRVKDGKQHRYYTVVESRRLQSGKVAQRQVLYLGEINDSQQAAWRRTLEVFDEAEQRIRPLSLFPEDRPVPADAIDSVQVKLGEMKLERALPYGNCWLGCELWRQLQLDRFWSKKLPQGREGVAWPQVLELLVVNRLIEPGSEFRLHRHWFDHSAMDVLLGQDFAVAEKDRLYRCLDRMLEHNAQQNGFSPGTSRQKVMLSASAGSAPTASGVAASYYVTARVTEQNPLTFLAVLGGGMWGTVSARASAGVLGTAAGSCIYVLDPSGHTALNMSNGVSVTSECGVYVDSSATDAPSVVGGATLRATNSTTIKVVGGASVNNGGSTSPSALTGQTVIADPFLSKSVPWSLSASTRTYTCDYTGCNHTTCDHTNYSSSTFTTQLTLDPGVYCGGIAIGNVQSVVFHSGVYILKGGGMNLGGLGGISGGASGSNVVFFNTGDNTTYRGITLGNGIPFTFSAPTTGSLAGLLFYQDPGITAPTAGASATASYFNGGSELSLQGSL